VTNLNIAVGEYARQGQQVRSSTSHLGFRCVIRE